MERKKPMIEKMRKELYDISAKLERKKKISHMLQDLYEKEKKISQKADTLKKELMKEEGDVERLEKTTPTSLLYSFMGKKEDKLSKEQKEVYAAKLKYDGALIQLDDLRANIAALNKEMQGLSACEEEYERVFEGLKALLKKESSYGEALCTLDQKYSEAMGLLKEIEEAYIAGEKAKEQIAYLEESLNSAEGWGVFDLLGGGFISDMAKHSHLDEAQETATYVQVLLNRFHTELVDVSVNKDVGDIQIDGFLKFADFFWDGIFSDWYVLSSIQSSKENIRQIRLQMEEALSALYSAEDNCIGKIRGIEKEIADIIL